MTSKDFDVVIVGAGWAGAHAAMALRQQKYSGSIVLLGDEPTSPYDRPALSKTYLSGEKSFESLLLRPDGYWSKNDIDVTVGCEVLSVDPISKTARCADGRSFGYTKLVWCAGGKPRRLICAGHDLRGVHYIRRKDDVDRISAELARCDRITIIGGGYIGLEAAATLVGLGKNVTVLEAQDRLLSRVAGQEISEFFLDKHREHGVDVRLQSKVRQIEGADQLATGVRLTSGEFIPSEMVIVGIGIAPTIGPLISAGAVGLDGLQVDAQCRTSLDDVFAIGDCALHQNSYANGSAIRLESIQNATDMASTVASVIIGGSAAYRSLPWFWSDQYDVKLQTVGLSNTCDATVVRGSRISRSFSVVYLKSGEVVALDCVNASRDYVRGRALVLKRARRSVEDLANVDTPL